MRQPATAAARPCPVSSLEPPRTRPAIRRKIESRRSPPRHRAWRHTRHARAREARAHRGPSAPQRGSPIRSEMDSKYSARSRRQAPRRRGKHDSISCPISLRNPSLPAGIIVTGATPTGASGDRHPQCQLKRVSRAARATKKWGRSRHSLPLPTDAEQGWVYGANHKETEMIRDIEMCALTVCIDPRFQCTHLRGVGFVH